MGYWLGTDRLIGIGLVVADCPFDHIFEQFALVNPRVGVGDAVNCAPAHCRRSCVELRLCLFHELFLRDLEGSGFQRWHDTSQWAGF